MRTWLSTLSKAVWGIYLILTSAYCLLAFLPYTYVGLIKEPPYPWMPWFASHHAVLYLLVLAGLAITQWPPKKNLGFLVLLGFLAAAGAYLLVRPFMTTLQDNQMAYWWAVIALVPLTITAGWELRSNWQNSQNEADGMYSYSNAMLIAVFVTLIYGLGGQLHTYAESASLHVDSAVLQLSLWSLISHILLAVAIVSVFNLIRLASRRTQNPTRMNLKATAALGFIVLWTALSRFLGSAFSFEGWQAHLYAASLTTALMLWVAWLAIPFLANPGTKPLTRRHKFGFIALVFALSAYAVV